MHGSFVVCTPPSPSVPSLRYGRTMQQNWMAYRADPGRFTVAWQDKTMEHGAGVVLSMVRELLGLPPSDAVAAE
jgi:hypothetical protein